MSARRLANVAAAAGIAIVPLSTAPLLLGWRDGTTRFDTVLNASALASLALFVFGIVALARSDRRRTERSPGAMPRGIVLLLAAILPLDVAYVLGLNYVRSRPVLLLRNSMDVPVEAEVVFSDGNVSRLGRIPPQAVTWHRIYSRLPRQVRTRAQRPSGTVEAQEDTRRLEPGYDERVVVLPDGTLREGNWVEFLQQD